MFRIHHLTLDKMTGAWLLPVVPTIVAAAAGSVVAAEVGASHSMTVIAVSYVLFVMGMGAALFITVMHFLVEPLIMCLTVKSLPLPFCPWGP